MNSAQPLTKEEQRDPSPPPSVKWVLDEVLYATPPGCGDDDIVMTRKRTNSHFVTRIDGDHVEPFAQHRDTQHRAESRA